MKKATTSRPSVSSLREMPEVDVGRYRVRRNVFAARIDREGMTIVHDAPTKASVREIPEADFARTTPRRNPYVTRAAEPRAQWQYGRGRPARGKEIGPTTVRSLRLPDDAWAALDREAKRRKTTTHALLRELVAMFLEREVT